MIIDYFDPVRAIRFDGLASYADTPLTGYPTAAASMSAWVKINSTMSATTTFNFIGPSGGVTRWFTFGKGATASLAIRGGFSGGAIGHFRTSPAGYNTDQWYHFLATYDGTLFVSYIDGVQIGSTNVAGQTILLSGSTLQAARFSSNYAPVTMDEISIWNRAVTVSEVATSNQPIDLYGASGLVRWYTMGDRYVLGSYSLRDRMGGAAFSWVNAVESTQVVAR